MTYHKPGVVRLDTAVRVIQGIGGKGLDVYQETRHPLQFNATIGAYEADE